MEKAFTTFEVARMCGVFHTTVINWVNKGKLTARVTPGGHRRIPHAELLVFMRKYDMPIPPALSARKKRLLIIDDDPMIVNMISRGMSNFKSKLAIEVCDNGVDALVQIGRDMPDLLLLDLVMPVMDGFQVCRILKSSKVTKGIKIIAFSGKTLSKSEKKFMDKHTDAFFHKPFKLSQIADRIRDIAEVH